MALRRISEVRHSCTLSICSESAVAMGQWEMIGVWRPQTCAYDQPADKNNSFTTRSRIIHAAQMIFVILDYKMAQIYDTLV